MINKKDYLEEKAAEYDRRIKADKLARKLERKIAEIREMGFKLIVLGNTVKIT